MGFKNKEIDAALKMFGTAEDRAMPHPLQHCGPGHPLKHCGSDMMHSGGWNKMRSMNSPGTVGNDASYNKSEKLRSHPVKNIGVNAAKAGYDAMETINQLKSSLNPTSSAYHGNIPQGSSGMGASVALPGVPDQNANFSSGSYANPSSTTDSGANSNSSSLNYSFMEDMNEGPQSKKQDPNRNKFGFHKRNKTSLDARIKQAEADGKLAKKARLEKKLKNFEANQKARAEGNIFDKLNPKNIV